MKLLFLPALLLMQRLRFPAKFALTGALFLAVLGYLGWHSISTLNLRLQQIVAEQDGSALVADLVSLNQALIEYRRVAVNAPVGDDAVKPRLQALSTANTMALDKLDADVAAARRHFDLSDRATELRTSWTGIESAVMALPTDAEFSAKAFAAHARIFDLIYTTIREIGDRSGIALEPDMDLFYLGFPLANNIPRIAGMTVRVRAYESMNLARGTLTNADRVFYEVVDARLKDAIGASSVMLEQSMQANPAAKTRLAPLLTTLKTASADQLAFAREQFIKAERLGVNGDQVSEHSRPAVEAAWALVTGTRELFEEQLAVRAGEVRLQRWLLALSVLGCALGSIYLFVGMYLSVSDSVRGLKDGSARLAGGDFRTPVQLTARDELGEVSLHFNTMMRALGDLMVGLKDSAGGVLDAANGLAQSAEHLSQGSRAQASAAQATASAVDQVSASVRGVSDNVSETVQVSEAAAGSAAEGRTVILAAAAETRSVADLVGQLTTDVTRLGGRADEIGLIVNTIQGIADQTNLLALNAAIEAARAGEAGRGFAVVADEVRKLAENTRRSTEDIAGMISKVQADVKSSIAQAETSRAQVLKGVDMTESAVFSLDRIRESAESTAQRIRDIAHASREQAQASEEIAHNVEKISQMSDDNSTAIAGVTTAAQQLRTLAGDVEHSLAAFRVA